MSEALTCAIQNIGDITKKLSWLCWVEDKRSQHLAEKLDFRLVNTFYNVKPSGFEQPEDFYYYILEL